MEETVKITKSFFLTITIAIVINPLLYAQQDSGFKTTALIPDFQVNDNGGPSVQNSSAIAADNSGNFFVVWEDLRDEFSFDTAPGGDIYLQRMDIDGTLLGSRGKK